MQAMSILCIHIQIKVALKSGGKHEEAKSVEIFFESPWKPYQGAPQPRSDDNTCYILI